MRFRISAKAPKTASANLALSAMNTAGNRNRTVARVPSLSRRANRTECTCGLSEHVLGETFPDSECVQSTHGTFNLDHDLLRYLMFPAPSCLFPLEREVLYLFLTTKKCSAPSQKGLGASNFLRRQAWRLSFAPLLLQHAPSLIASAASAHALLCSCTLC